MIHIFKEIHFDTQKIGWEIIMANGNGETDLLQKKSNGVYADCETKLNVSKYKIFFFVIIIAPTTAATDYNITQLGAIKCINVNNWLMRATIDNIVPEEHTHTHTRAHKY